jgi:HSP20 family protein
VEARQENDKLTVRCDLPGVDPKDVEVSLEGDTLTISGERRTDSKREKDGGRYSEKRYGRFERVLRVPDGLDPEKLTARYASGVLEITVPSPKDRRSRNIPVQMTQGNGPKQAA